MKQTVSSYIYTPSSKPSFWLKTVAILVVTAVGHSSVLAPWAEADFWEDRRRAAHELKNPADAPATQMAGLPLNAGEWALPSVALEKSAAWAALAQVARQGAAARTEDLPAWILSLPSAYADIQKIHLSPRPGRPVVMLVQDAHQILSAQSSIAKLLDHMDARLAAPGAPLLVGLEGAAGPLRLSPYRSTGFPDLREKAAQYLLRQNFINGPEYYGITAPRDTRLWGIENPGLYMDNVDAYRAAAPQKDALLKNLKGLENALDSAKEGLFSLDLWALDKNLAAYHRGELDLLRYVRHLAQAAPDMSKFPQAGRLLDALAMEETINFRQVEAERLAFLQRLSQKAPAAKLKTLLQNGVAYRAGQISAGFFYEQVLALAKSQGVSPQSFPAFQNYLRYVLLAENIDRHRLFDDVEGLKQAAMARLAKTPAQRAMLAAADDIRLVERLAGQNLGPAEWDLYQSRRTDIAALPARVRELTAGVGVGAPFESATLAGLLPMFEKFYGAALARNRAMVDNLLQRAQETGAARMALVAGGFHTPGIEALLVERDLSVVTFTPRIGEIPKDGDSLAFFTDVRTPLEHLMLGDKLDLAPPALTAQTLPGSMARWAGAARQVPSIFAARFLDLVRRAHPNQLPQETRKLAKAQGQDIHVQSTPSGSTLVEVSGPAAGRATLFVRPDGEVSYRPDLISAWKGRAGAWWGRFTDFAGRLQWPFENSRQTALAGWTGSNQGWVWPVWRGLLAASSTLMDEGQPVRRGSRLLQNLPSTLPSFFTGPWVDFINTVNEAYKSGDSSENLARAREAAATLKKASESLPNPAREGINQLVENLSAMFTREFGNLPAEERQVLFEKAQRDWLKHVKGFLLNHGLYVPLLIRIRNGTFLFDSVVSALPEISKNRYTYQSRDSGRHDVILGYRIDNLPRSSLGGSHHVGHDINIAYIDQTQVEHRKGQLQALLNGGPLAGKFENPAIASWLGSRIKEANIDIETLTVFYILIHELSHAEHGASLKQKEFTYDVLPDAQAGEAAAFIASMAFQVEQEPEAFTDLRIALVLLDLLNYFPAGGFTTDIKNPYSYAAALIYQNLNDLLENPVFGGRPSVEQAIRVLERFLVDRALKQDISEKKPSELAVALMKDIFPSISEGAPFLVRGGLLLPYKPGAAATASQRGESLVLFSLLITGLAGGAWLLTGLLPTELLETLGRIFASLPKMPDMIRTAGAVFPSLGLGALLAAPLRNLLSVVRGWAAAQLTQWQARRELHRFFGEAWPALWNPEAKTRNGRVMSDSLKRNLLMVHARRIDRLIPDAGFRDLISRTVIFKEAKSVTQEQADELYLDWMDLNRRLLMPHDIFLRVEPQTGQDRLSWSTYRAEVSIFLPTHEKLEFRTEDNVNHDKEVAIFHGYRRHSHNSPRIFGLSYNQFDMVLVDLTMAREQAALCVEAMSGTRKGPQLDLRGDGDEPNPFNLDETMPGRRSLNTLIHRAYHIFPSRNFERRVAKMRLVGSLYKKFAVWHTAREIRANVFSHELSHQQQAFVEQLTGMPSAVHAIMEKWLEEPYLSQWHALPQSAVWEAGAYLGELSQQGRVPVETVVGLLLHLLQRGNSPHKQAAPFVFRLLFSHPNQKGEWRGQMDKALVDIASDDRKIWGFLDLLTLSEDFFYPIVRSWFSPETDSTVNIPTFDQIARDAANTGHLPIYQPQRNPLSFASALRRGIQPRPARRQAPGTEDAQNSARGRPDKGWRPGENVAQGYVPFALVMILVASVAGAVWLYSAGPENLLFLQSIHPLVRDFVTLALYIYGVAIIILFVVGLPLLFVLSLRYLPRFIQRLRAVTPTEPAPTGQQTIAPVVLQAPFPALEVPPTFTYLTEEEKLWVFFARPWTDFINALASAGTPQATLQAMAAQLIFFADHIDPSDSWFRVRIEDMMVNLPRLSEKMVRDNLVANWRLMNGLFLIPRGFYGYLLIEDNRYKANIFKIEHREFYTRQNGARAHLLFNRRIDQSETITGQTFSYGGERYLSIDLDIVANNARLAVQAMRDYVDMPDEQGPLSLADTVAYWFKRTYENTSIPYLTNAYYGYLIKVLYDEMVANARVYQIAYWMWVTSRQDAPPAFEAYKDFFGSKNRLNQFVGMVIGFLEEVKNADHPGIPLARALGHLTSQNPMRREAGWYVINKLADPRWIPTIFSDIPEEEKNAALERARTRFSEIADRPAWVQGLADIILSQSFRGLERVDADRFTKNGPTGTDARPDNAPGAFNFWPDPVRGGFWEGVGMGVILFLAVRVAVVLGAPFLSPEAAVWISNIHFEEFPGHWVGFGLLYILQVSVFLYFSAFFLNLGLHAALGAWVRPGINPRSFSAVMSAARYAAFSVRFYPFLIAFSALLTLYAPHFWQLWGFLIAAYTAFRMGEMHAKDNQDALGYRDEKSAALVRNIEDTLKDDKLRANISEQIAPAIESFIRNRENGRLLGERFGLPAIELKNRLTKDRLQSHLQNVHSRSMVRELLRGPKALEPETDKDGNKLGPSWFQNLTWSMNTPMRFRAEGLLEHFPPLIKAIAWSSDDEKRESVFNRSLALYAMTQGILNHLLMPKRLEPNPTDPQNPAELMGQEAMEYERLIASSPLPISYDQGDARLQKLLEISSVAESLARDQIKITDQELREALKRDLLKTHVINLSRNTRVEDPSHWFHIQTAAKLIASIDVCIQERIFSTIPSVVVIYDSEADMRALEEHVKAEFRRLADAKSEMSPGLMKYSTFHRLLSKNVPKAGSGSQDLTMVDMASLLMGRFKIPEAILAAGINNYWPPSSPLAPDVSGLPSSVRENIFFIIALVGRQPLVIKSAEWGHMLDLLNAIDQMA